MRRVFWASYLVTAISFLTFSAAFAQETVRFCFNTWLPFSYVSDKKPAGISIEIIRQAAQDLGYKAKFIELPWKRCLQDVKDGKIHAVIDAAHRKNFLQGPTSFSLFTNTVWVHRDNPLNNYSSNQVLEGKTLGLVDGYDYPDEFDEDAKARIDLSIDDTSLLKKLSAKRVDFAVTDMTNTLALQHSLQRNNKPLLNIKPLRPTPSFDPLYLSFNQKFSTLQQQFDARFKSMLVRGDVDRIYTAHIGKSLNEIMDSVRIITK